MPVSETQLSQKKCVPCRGGIQPLKEQEAKKYLKQVSNWSLENGAKKIQKNFEFKNFVQAMNFINRIAGLAEQEEHHPDIFISYNKVTIKIFTHAIGGLHENDFILAAKIDQIQK